MLQLNEYLTCVRQKELFEFRQTIWKSFFNQIELQNSRNFLYGRLVLTIGKNTPVNRDNII